MKQRKTNSLKLLWYTHPRSAIAATLIVVNLAIIVLFTVVMSLVKGENFFQSLSFLFTFTISSDDIYDFVKGDTNVAVFMVEFVLAAIQMVIFSGALIGFTTDILQSTIDKRMRNVGKLNLKNHFVFLNWSAIGPNLIYDLAFLDGKKNVVVLCEEDRDEVMTSIENIFTENGKKMNNINLLIKNGSPSSTKHLSDISLSDARYIGVLLTEHESENDKSISVNDLVSFKILMSILHLGAAANIVVEVETGETVLKIESFLKDMDESLLNRVSVFAHNSVIGHVLGRSVVNPIYSSLFHNVLSYDGCEIYTTETMDLTEALCHYGQCIPVVNYDDDGDETADRLYVIAENANSLRPRKTPKSFVRPINYCENILRDEFTLIIFSDSDRSSFVIDEIETYNALFDKNVRYEIHSYSENIDDVVERMKDIEGRKRILFLSSEKAEDSAQDADIFISLISLKINNSFSDDIPIFAELVNPRNLISMQNLGAVSVIVSNKIISLFMLQLLTHPGSRRFFKDIIVANKDNERSFVDFDVVNAEELLVFDGDEMHFACKAEFIHSLFAASGNSKMCVGVRYENSDSTDIRFLCNDMDKAQDFVLHPKDELILVTQ